MPYFEDFEPDSSEECKAGLRAERDDLKVRICEPGGAISVLKDDSNRYWDEVKRGMISGASASMRLRNFARPMKRSTVLTVMNVFVPSTTANRRENAAAQARRSTRPE
jgi:hypothetical protein